MATRIRSKLANADFAKALLHKIKGLHALKASSLVFEVDGVRHSAADCTNVALDPDAADDQIVFQAPGDVAERYYDIADIEQVKRLRTRKYLIEIKAGADSAQATA